MKELLVADLLCGTGVHERLDHTSKQLGFTASVRHGLNVREFPEART